MRRRTRIANSKLLRQYVRDMRKWYRNRDFKLEDQLRRTKRGRQQVNLLWNQRSPWKCCPVLDQMKRIVRRCDDPHTETAGKMFNVPPSEVTAEQRKAGKTANFELLYGGPREVKLDVMKSRAPKPFPIHFGEKL